MSVGCPKNRKAKPVNIWNTVTHRLFLWYKHTTNYQQWFTNYNNFQQRLSTMMEVLHIPDESLLQALQEHTSDTVIPEKLAYITELEWNYDRPDANRIGWDKIEDLSGLELCRNLKVLMLDGNAITDISPLMALKNLEELWLIKNPLQSLNPLGYKPKLKVLNLAHCQNIEDLSPLANLPELIQLNVAHTRVADIMPLTTLPHLLDLNLLGTPIDIVNNASQREALIGMLMNGVNIKMDGIGALEKEASRRLEDTVNLPQNNLIEFLRRNRGFKLADFVSEHGIDGRMDTGFGRNAENVSVLHVALEPPSGDYHDDLQNRKEVVKRLLDEGAPLEYRTNYGSTPLVYYLMNNPEARLSMVRLLVDAGADIHTHNEGRVSPLSAAAQTQREDIVNYLIAAGAEIHDPFVLRAFVQKGFNDLVVKALHEGYGHRQPHKLGNLLLDAVLKDNLPIVHLLLQKGANPDGNIHYSAFYNVRSAQAVELLVAAGAEVTSVDDSGQNALHKVAWRYHLDAARALVKHGCSVIGDQNGNLPIHLITYQSFNEYKCKAMVKFFVEELGVDINAKNQKGQTLYDLNSNYDFEVFLTQLGAKQT